MNSCVISALVVGVPHKLSAWVAVTVKDVGE